MRLDVYLAANGFVKSRETAQRLIREGAVTIDKKTAKKPSDNIDESVEHEINVSDSLKFVSRGGLKLERALDAFEIDVTGVDAVDIGASTGGFTDCLLQRGAAKIRCVDVGRSQLDKRLENDPRVTSFEGMNARYITPEDIGGECELVVCDVSFISLTLIVGAVSGLLPENGRFIALIKPQFEAGRAALDKHGVVRDRERHIEVIKKVIDSAAERGLFCGGLTVSPIEGGDGNREYLALFTKNADHGVIDAAYIKRMVYGN